MASLITFVQTYYAQFFQVLMILVVAAEGVVRLIPTQTGLGALERIGSILTTIMDFLKIPNNLRTQPVIPIPTVVTSAAAAAPAVAAAASEAEAVVKDITKPAA